MVANIGSEWINFCDNVFEVVKRRFGKSYPIMDEEDTSSSLLALRDAIFSLPCAVKVLELKNDAEKYEHIKDNICQILGYDFSRLGKVSVDYLGIMDAENTDLLRDVLVENLDFGREEATDFVESFCREFKTVGLFDPDKPDLYIQFTFYNILNNQEEYVRELFHLFAIGFLPFVEKFRKDEIDWNSLYGLEKDPILSLSEIIRRDPIMDGFLGLETIEQVQEAISDIQLIPSVPKEKKRVFDRAFLGSRCGSEFHCPP